MIMMKMMMTMVLVCDDDDGVGDDGGDDDVSGVVTLDRPADNTFIDIGVFLKRQSDILENPQPLQPEKQHPAT